jgi:hypothetical protein
MACNPRYRYNSGTIGNSFMAAMLFSRQGFDQVQIKLGENTCLWLADGGMLVTGNG